MAPGLFIVAVTVVLQTPVRRVLLARIDCAPRARRGLSPRRPPQTGRPPSNGLIERAQTTAPQFGPSRNHASD